MMSDDEGLRDDEFDEYESQIEKSQGFDVDSFSTIEPGMIIPEGGSDRESILYSQLALHHYNHSKDADFEFVEVDHKNIQVVKGLVSYITFKAKSTSGSILTFQARLWEDITGPSGVLPLEVELCRVKPGEDSARHSPPENIKQASEIEAEKIVSAEEIDVSYLDHNDKWLGNAIVANDEVYNNYCKQVLDSEGFDVNSNIPLMFAGQIIPLETSEHSRNLVPVFAELALSHYVWLQVRDTSIYTEMDFCRIEKAYVQTNSFKLASLPFKAKHANFYITFTAENKSDYSTQTFQTKVWKRVLDDGHWKIKVMFVRLMPTFEGNASISNKVHYL